MSERMRPEGRVSCWWCDGDLIPHMDREQLKEDGEDFDEWYERIIDAFVCQACGAQVLVMLCREREEGFDGRAEDAPYDRNRCPRCGGYAIWQSDFNYDEVYGEGEGIVSYLSCQRCGVTLEYSLRCDEDDDGNGELGEMRDSDPEGDGEPDAGADKDRSDDI